MLIVKSFCCVNLCNEQDLQAFTFFSCMIIIIIIPLKGKAMHALVVGGSLSTPTG